MRLVLSIILVFSIAATCAARKIHVNNTSGDDIYTGHVAIPLSDGSGPVHSINRAIELSTAGDIIVIANTGVPYHEAVSLTGAKKSGFPGAPYTIEGNGAILDGSAPVPEEAWEHYEGRVFRFQPPRHAFQQVFLDGRPATRVVTTLTASGPPKLNKLEWCWADGCIFFCVEKDRLPSDYDITYAKLQTGITLCHVRDVMINDLTVQGFQLDGINAANNARSVTLDRLTVRGCGRAGITSGGACDITISNSLLGNNGRAQLLSLPNSKTLVERSDLIGGAAPAWKDNGGRVYLEGFLIEGGRDDMPLDGAAKDQ